MTGTKQALLGASAALALCASIGLEAAAQDADNAAAARGTEVIVVTAQKREESILDVPINLTAYRGEFLNSIGIEEFNQLAAFVPGLVVQEQSVNNPGFVLRGITSDSGAANIEPRVSVFQDGVSISRSRGSIVQLFDLDRIEVLKGPQGTLFGRSAQIGAIHLITNKPEYDIAAGIKGEVGNFDRTLIEGYVNVPIVEDKLAFRFSGIQSKRDGNIANTEGGDFNGTDTGAMRASLRFDPAENFRLNIVANYQKDTPSGTSFKSGVIPARGGSADPNSTASLNTFGGFLDGAPLSIDREVWGVTVQADWAFSDAWSLTNIAAYRSFDSLEIFDPDGTAFDILIFAEDAFGQQWSEELRFNYDGGRTGARFLRCRVLRRTGQAGRTARL